jgi:hypothetical protein
VQSRNRRDSLSHRGSRLHVAGGRGWHSLRNTETSVSIADEKNDATQEGIGEVSSLMQVENLSYLSGIHAICEAEVVLPPPPLGVRADAVFIELGDGIEDLFQEATALQVKVAFREVAKQKCILFFLGGASVCGAARKLVEIDVAAHVAAIFPEMYDERSHVSICVLAQDDRSVMRWHVRDYLSRHLCLLHRSCVHLCWEAMMSKVDGVVSSYGCVVDVLWKREQSRIE